MMRVLKYSAFAFGLVAFIGSLIVFGRFVFKDNKQEMQNPNNENIYADGNVIASPEIDVTQMLPPTPNEKDVKVTKPEEIINDKSANINASLEADASQIAAMSDCKISSQKTIAVRNWQEKGIVTAIAEGTNCGNALVRISVQDNNGDKIFTMTAPARDFGINANSSQTEMKEALDKALPNSAAHAKAYAKWVDDASKPFGTEFDQITYEKIREADSPVICLKLPSAPQTCIAANPNNGAIKTFTRG